MSARVRGLAVRLLWPLLIRVGQNLYPFDDEESHESPR